MSEAELSKLEEGRCLFCLHSAVCRLDLHVLPNSSAYFNNRMHMLNHGLRNPGHP